MRRLVTVLASRLLPGDGELARLAADVVALADRDGVAHVLLMRRDWPPFKGCWALPGGHVEPGEDVAVAAVRELAEETGIDVGSARPDPVGVYSAPGRDPRGRYVTWAWLVRLDGMPEPTAGTDARDARWAPVTEAVGEGLAFDHAQILTDAVVRLGHPVPAAVD